ncbi:uncharacterized protein LOC132710751 [Pantherophis guttatus]|uniref:Uncharacterized protein LOC132710751 n=1 Tax=Pantherophis guttatus TaxID=94885 RepID=A0ABM3Z5Z7_PANGU|nr:uncharacterized protein LOC132710751 [Pantherophis guttatus]
MEASLPVSHLSPLQAGIPQRAPRNSSSDRPAVRDRIWSLWRPPSISAELLGRLFFREAPEKFFSVSTDGSWTGRRGRRRKSRLWRQEGIETGLSFPFSQAHPPRSRPSPSIALLFPALSTILALRAKSIRGRPPPTEGNSRRFPIGPLEPCLSRILHSLALTPGAPEEAERLRESLAGGHPNVPRIQKLEAICGLCKVNFSLEGRKRAESLAGINPAPLEMVP